MISSNEGGAFCWRIHANLSLLLWAWNADSPDSLRPTFAQRLLKCFHCYAACSITRQKRRHKSTYTFHTQPQRETTLTLFWSLPPPMPHPNCLSSGNPLAIWPFPTRIGILLPLGIRFMGGQQMNVHSASQFIRKHTKVFIVKRKRFCCAFTNIFATFVQWWRQPPFSPPLFLLFLLFSPRQALWAFSWISLINNEQQSSKKLRWGKWGKLNESLENSI